MKYVRIVAAALLVALTVSSLAGCGKVAEKAAEKAAEEAVEGVAGVEVDVDENKVTVQGDDGTTVEAQSGTSDVPEGFPQDFPVYDGAIEGSSKVAAGDAAQYFFLIKTGDSPEKVLAWYKGKLQSSGWTVVTDSTSTMGGQTQSIITVDKAGYFGGVTIEVVDGTTQITVSVGTK